MKDYLQTTSVMVVVGSHGSNWTLSQTELVDSIFFQMTERKKIQIPDDDGGSNRSEIQCSGILRQSRGTLYIRDPHVRA